MLGRDPVDGGLHLAAVGGVPAAGVGVIPANQPGHRPVRAGDRIPAAQEVAGPQPHLPAGRQPPELGRRVGHEVVPFDPQPPGEGHLPGAGRVVGGVVGGVAPLHPALGPVLDHHLQRPQHRHPAGGMAVVVIAPERLQQLDLMHALHPVHPDVLAEGPDGLGRVSPAAHPPQGGHAGVVPPVHLALGHQPGQHPLGGDGVGEVQAGELALAGLMAGQGKPVQEPVVQRPVGVELQAAQRVGDPFDGVALAVGPVVGGVDAPVVAGAEVG